MNERILELAIEARKYAETKPDIYSDAYDKKFAELIVGECTNIVADAVDHREPASTYVNKIKQHFGVEE